MIYLFLLIIISLLYPRIYIRLILFTSFIIPGAHSHTDIFGVEFLGFNLSYMDLLFFSLIFSIFIKIIVFKKKKIRINDLSKKVLIFLIYNLIFLLIGIILYNDFSRSFYDSRPIFYYSILLFNLKDFGFDISLKSLTYTIFFGMFIYCLMVFSIFIFLDSHPLFIYFEEDNSITLGRLIFQQEYLFLLIFPLILNLIISEKVDNKIKFIFFIALIAYSAKIFLSMSRGMIFFLILTIIPYSLIKLRKHSIVLNKNILKKYFYLIIIGSVSFIFILTLILPNLLVDAENVINYFVGRFSGIFESDSSKFVSTHVTNRLIMWETGITEAFKSLVFGHGYGYSFTIDHPEWSGIKLSFIDSTYLTIIIRVGLIGLVLFFSIYFSVLKKIRTFYNNTVDKLDFDSIFYRNLFISLFVILFYSFFNSVLIFSVSVFPLLIIINLCLNKYNYEKP